MTNKMRKIAAVATGEEATALSSCVCVSVSVSCPFHVYMAALTIKKMSKETLYSSARRVSARVRLRACVLVLVLEEEEGMAKMERKKRVKARRITRP